MMFEKYHLGLKSLCIAGFLSLIGFSAQAQGTIFCPSTINGVTGFRLVNGLCTNNNTGAFSTAALSSQALGDIQQSVTQQTTTATLDAISARRKEETERCTEGFERSTDGTCKRIVASDPGSRVSSPKKRKTAAPMMPVKPPPVVVDQGWRWGAWAHGFGDYERRTASGTGIVSIAGVGGAGAQTLAVDLTQTSRTGGGIGGVDVTLRNLFGSNDGLIVGILTGYVSTDISLNGTSAPTAPINNTTVGIGTSTGKIRVSGPSVGGYYTYFNGAFSNDTTLKADFLSINETFSESMPFNNLIFVGGVNQLVSGSGSANVTNFVAAQNFQYRLPVSAVVWFEPTVGYRYTNSHYDSGGAALGLQDGYDWRVQGGGRFGIESFWNAVHVTTTITGLAYSDVKIVGGPITGGATTGSFAGGTVLPSDEGKVRGEGIFLANFDYGRGFSTFVQADVRGGSGLFGAGGRIGARMQF
jgi:hypothetical protein